MTLELKFLLCIDRNIFDFKITPVRYYVFPVAINVFLSGCITRIGTDRNYCTNTIIPC